MVATIDPEQSSRAEPMLLAWMEHGSYSADLVGAFLKIWLKEIGFRGRPVLPAEFLREVAAILCVARWQASGIFPQAQQESPNWVELWDQLRTAFFEDPLSFSCDRDHPPTVLERQVMLFWFKHCSWAAPANLAIDVAIQGGDQDSIRDPLALSLWRHRRLTN